MNDSIFDPAHVFYGFGGIECGESIVVTTEIASERGDALTSVQRRVHSYGSHSGKSFITKSRDGNLYIKRVR